jgi:hypothetical protein
MQGCVTHLVELSRVRILVREKILPRTINILTFAIQKQKRVCLMESSQITRGKGRFRKPIKNDLEINELDRDMILEHYGCI